MGEGGKGMGMKGEGAFVWKGECGSGESETGEGIMGLWSEGWFDMDWRTGVWDYWGLGRRSGRPR